MAFREIMKMMQDVIWEERMNENLKYTKFKYNEVRVLGWYASRRDRHTRGRETH